MGKKNWGYYAAYAVLVIGAGLTLMLSERPLSSTVVTLALFSFNIAAIIFLVPQVLDFITQIKGTNTAPNNNAEILEQLKDIKYQLAALKTASPAKETHQPVATTPVVAPVIHTPVQTQVAPTITIQRAPVTTPNTSPAATTPVTPTPSLSQKNSDFISRLRNNLKRETPEIASFDNIFVKSSIPPPSRDYDDTQLFTKRQHPYPSPNHSCPA